MASATPHRDAVEQGLADMRAAYEALPPADTLPERASRELTMAMTEAAMRCLGDHRDRGVHDKDFGGGFTAALGNVAASVSETMTNCSPPVSLMLVDTFLSGALAQAVRRIAEQHPDSFNQVMVEMPEPHPNRERDMDWGW